MKKLKICKWKEDATHGLMLLRSRNYNEEKNNVTR
jgi:hypothetical protein